MSTAQRLQLTYQSLPEASARLRVLTYLQDRDEITAAQAKEQSLEALTAWFAADAFQVQEDSVNYRQALSKAIAALDARSAYCRSLLALVDGDVLRSPVSARVTVQSGSVTPPVEPASIESNSKSEPDSNLDIDDVDEDIDADEDAEIGQLPFVSNASLDSLFEG